jgi:hypothetical protein
MKKCIFVMIATMILVPLYLTAQVFHEAVNPEDYTNAPSINNVTNTGADMVIDDMGYSKVMVFDGDAPQFAWETNNGTGTDYFHLDAVWDPDVVLTNDLMYALVCLEIQNDENGQIYLSLWEYNGSGNYSEVIGQFGAYSFPHYIADGTNPNIDIGFDGRFVITWQSTYTAGDINAIAGLYNNGVLTISNDIARVVGVEAWAPDVAIRGNAVSFTYIGYCKDGYPAWYGKQASYSDVQQPPTPPNVIPANNYTFHESAQNNYGDYGRPRIASPPPYPYYSNSDFAVVVDYYWEDAGIGSWDILFANRNNGVVYGPTIFNPWFSGLTPSYEPVVAYIGDHGVVAWTTYIEYPGTTYTSYDVVGMYFHTTGSNGNYWSGFPHAPVVNSHYNGDQRTSSVAGRRWNDGLGFYFWVDEDANDMAYRDSYEGTTNMRMGKDSLFEASGNAAVGIEIFYNNRTIQIMTEQQNYDCQLLDITGRVILHKTASFETIISLEGISPGIYFIRCQTPYVLETLKFLIH